jgi:hypothetical protein
LDPLIKSQLLYQLSYAPFTIKSKTYEKGPKSLAPFWHYHTLSANLTGTGVAVTRRGLALSARPGKHENCSEASDFVCSASSCDDP